MINVIQYGDEYRITFPFDYEIKNLVANTFGRKWNPEGKYWSIPKESLGMLISQFKGTKFEDMVVIKSLEEINVDQNIDETTKIPDIDISPFLKSISEYTEMYSHQKDFLKFGIDRENKGNFNGFLVCDEQGVGKTIESLYLALYNKKFHNFKRCLIICCVNMSKYNWMNEIEYHTAGEYSGYILGSRKGRGGKINFGGSSADKVEDLKNLTTYGEKDGEELPYFIITNVEVLRMRSGKLHPFADTLIELIKSGEIDSIIIDEVHKNLSPSSQQGKQLLRIKKLTKDSVFWMPMTGTPIVNKPTDLFVPLRLIDAHKMNSFYTWNQQFCVYGGFGGHEVIGYKNISQLKQLLQINMIRRTKENALDLPAKIQFEEYVENTPTQNRLMKIVEGELWEDRETILESLNPLSRIMRLRQVNGSPEIIDSEIVIDKSYKSKNAKLVRLLELVEEIVLREEKVVVFSNWVEPLRMIYQFLKPLYKVCTFTGTMNEKERQLHKKTFIENPEYKIMLGTSSSLGTTHTLTVANNIIFYDEPWTASDKQQAEDRCHRIGSTKPLNVYTLLSKDTVDDRVHSIVYGKKAVSGFIVDNQIDIYNNPELFNFLLGRDK